MTPTTAHGQGLLAVVVLIMFYQEIWIMTVQYYVEIVVAALIRMSREDNTNRCHGRVGWKSAPPNGLDSRFDQDHHSQK